MSWARHLKETCVICRYHFDYRDLFKADCRHYFCAPCMTSGFKHSIKDGSLTPFQCCGIPVRFTPDIVYRLLGHEFIAKYAALNFKSLAVRPIYCHVQYCQAFIPDGYQIHGFASCPQCHAITCTKCTMKYHYGNCRPSEDFEKLKALALAKGWKKCYRCGTFVEKVAGCSHMM